MKQPTLKKAIRMQVEALDEFCLSLGLEKGVLEMRRVHHSYVATLPDGRKVHVGVAGSPRCADTCAKQAPVRLKREMEKVLGMRP